MGQRQKHALGIVQAPKLVEVRLHRVRVDDKLVDDAGKTCEREIERHGGIGPDHALHRGMGNVALVPKRHILQGGEGASAHEAGKPRDVFAENGVALVWHGRRALLTLREELFCFQHFGAL